MVLTSISSAQTQSHGGTTAAEGYKQGTLWNPGSSALSCKMDSLLVCLSCERRVPEMYVYCSERCYKRDLVGDRKQSLLLNNHIIIKMHSYPPETIAAQPKLSRRPYSTARCGSLSPTASTHLKADNV